MYQPNFYFHFFNSLEIWNGHNRNFSIYYIPLIFWKYEYITRFWINQLILNLPDKLLYLDTIDNHSFKVTIKIGWILLTTKSSFHFTLFHVRLVHFVWTLIFSKYMFVCCPWNPQLTSYLFPKSFSTLFLHFQYHIWGM